MTSLTIWQQLKEAMVPLLSFWVLHFFTFVVFCASILFLASGAGGEMLVIIAFLFVVVFGCCLFGQVMALLKVPELGGVGGGRDLLGVLFAIDMGFISVGLGDVAVFVTLALLLGPPAVWGGLWSLETNRALWSAWLPMIWMTGGILVWVDKMNKDNAWFAGDKYAVWDIVSVSVLGVTLLLLLFYLVTRETHRLALWKRGPDAPLPPTVPDRGAVRPRISLFGIVLLCGMAVALTVGTTLVSPYLWRTGPADHGDNDNPSQEQEPRNGRGDAPEPSEEQGEEDGWGKRMKEMGEQAQEAGKQAGSAACVSLSVIVLALLMWVVGWRPAKRLFLLRHLRDLWKVPPTTRIEHGWRMVEIALGDIGVFPLTGEDASGLARRARPVLEKLSPVEVHGLAEAADAADWVRFGLGVTEEDLKIMERFSAWTLDTIWERLSDREQLRAMYRGL